MMASTRHPICSRNFPASLFLIAALLCPVALAAAQEKSKDKKPEKEKKEKVEPWVEIRTAHFIVASDGGEKTARHFGEEFESVLHVFETTMPNARIGTGIPVRIFAAKNGESFARMAPEFAYDKRHEQPPGVYASGSEKTYIGVRANAGGHFPYADIFQSYARDIVKLSYRNLPPWLEEGYSTIYGSIIFDDRNIRLDIPDPEDLGTLFRSPLLPVELVMQVDRASPYYSPGDKASMYFAESRVLTHFFIVDPQFAGTKSMARYIAAIESGTNSLQAARDAFGDLDQLQTKFAAFVNRVKPPPTDFPLSLASDPGAPARILSAAEFEARRADFESLRGRIDDAESDLQEAITNEPSLALAEQCLGFLLLKKRNLDEAETHFQRAVQLDPKDALNFYGSGLVALAKAANPDAAPGAAEAFEKAAALNPDFADSWFNLALIYSGRDETLQKALADARRAASLAPGRSNYQSQLANIQEQLSHPEEARKTEARAQESASSRAAANKNADLAANASRTQPAAAPGSAGSVPAISIRTPPVPPATSPTPAAPAASAAPAATKTEPAAAPAAPLFSETKVYSMMGTIKEVNCASAPQIQLSLKSLTLLMKLHTADLSKLSIKSTDPDSPAKSPSCASLRGRTVRISYTLVLNQPWDGEMQELEFRNLP